jgi:hypothetical protein
MKEIKKKVNFNIDVEILNIFNKLAKEKAINKSQFIENYIKLWILENK